MDLEIASGRGKFILRRKEQHSSPNLSLRFSGKRYTLADRLRRTYLRMALSTPIMRAELESHLGVGEIGDCAKLDISDLEECARLIKQLEKLDEIVQRENEEAA